MPTTRKIFDLSVQRGVLIIIPQGDAVSFRDTDVEHELREILARIDDDDVNHLVVDLGSSSYFGSVMIGAISAIGRAILQQGGQMALCNASAEMKAVMAAMKLDELWKQFDSRSAAVKAVKAQSR